MVYGHQMNNGFNDSAYVRGMGGSDLGIPYYRAHDNTWGYVYGDTFRGIGLSGEYVGSPAIMCQAQFDASGSNGIEFTWAIPNNWVQQSMPYVHNADNGHRWEITRIPNGAIEVGSRTYMQCTSVKDWGTGQQDGVNLGMLFYSDDHGYSWNYGLGWLGEDFGGYSPFVQWSFADQDEQYLYIVSNRWNGSHNNQVTEGPILMRVNKFDVLNQSATNYQNWNNGQWVNGDQGFSSIWSNTTGERYGEHSVTKIGSTYVAAYFDVNGYCISTRTAPALTGPWSAPKKQIFGANPQWWLPSWPQLYGGYVHPGSPSLTNVHLVVSQWDTNNNNPYRCLQFSGINVL